MDVAERRVRDGWHGLRATRVRVRDVERAFTSTVEGRQDTVARSLPAFAAAAWAEHRRLDGLRCGDSQRFRRDTIEQARSRLPQLTDRVARLETERASIQTDTQQLAKDAATGATVPVGSAAAAADAIENNVRRPMLVARRWRHRPTGAPVANGQPANDDQLSVLSGTDKAIVATKLDGAAEIQAAMSSGSGLAAVAATSASLSTYARQQSNGYYCGPTSGQVVSNYSWVSPSSCPRSLQPPTPRPVGTRRRLAHQYRAWRRDVHMRRADDAF